MIAGGSVGNRLTIQDLPVVLVLAALGRTTQTPADPGRRRPGDAPTMGWRWDPAAPSPRPPGPIRRRWELPAAESKAPPPRPVRRHARVGGRLGPPDDPRSYALFRPRPRRRWACPGRRHLVPVPQEIGTVVSRVGVQKMYAQYGPRHVSCGRCGLRGRPGHESHAPTHAPVLLRPRSPSTPPYSEFRHYPGSACCAYGIPQGQPKLPRTRIRLVRDRAAPELRRGTVRPDLRSPALVVRGCRSRSTS